jgi:hypothetical protein
VRAAAPEPVRAEFARRLREAGLVVHEAFGASAQPIDLAVEDPRRPGHVLVAVESDGPGYAAMPSTRDRDRLRVEQLGRLGWEHVRVWSTDLFRDPARDVARVVALAQRASQKDAAVVGEGSVHEESLGEDPVGQHPVGQDSQAEESVDQEPDTAAESAPDSETEAGSSAEEDGRKRRVMRRRAKKAPEQTKDDTDAGWGELFDSSEHDRWLQEQRPPHWGAD